MATQTLSKDEMLEAIGNMSVFVLAELIAAFKGRFGVTIAAPAAAPAGAAAGAAAAAPAVEEKTEFTVVLKAGGEKKIQVIKEIRDHEPRSERGEGSRGGRARNGERRREQAGSRRNQKEAR